VVRCRDSLSSSVERLWTPYSQEMGEVRRILSFLWFALASSLRAIKLRPSMVYASSTPLFVGIPAVVSKTLLRSKMIFEVRDLWPDVTKALGFLKNRPTKWIAHWLESYFYRRADLIFSLSPEMVHHVNRSLKTTKPVHLLPNISNFEFFARARTPTTEKRDQRKYPRSNFIVYAGAFGLANGTDYLPLVAKGLAEKGLKTSLVAVGHGSHF
jgi:glycosyltransferase involved in cell wall biosynthesis